MGTVLEHINTVSDEHIVSRYLYIKDGEEEM